MELKVYSNVKVSWYGKEHSFKIKVQTVIGSSGISFKEYSKQQQPKYIFLE